MLGDVMIEFVLLMGISALFLLLSVYVKVNDKVLSGVYIIIASLFAANRDLSIPDTLAYIQLFENLNFDFISMLSNTYMEPGYIALSILVKFIFGNNYKILFFIITFFNMFLIKAGVYYFYESAFNENGAFEQKRNIKYTIPLVLYFMTYGYVFNFITIRTGIAFSLVFLAISLYKKSKVKSLFLYVLSINFHNSALLMLCSLPFLLAKKQKKEALYYSWIALIIPLSVIGYKNVVINLFFTIVNKVSFLASRFHAYTNENVIVDQKGAFIRLAVFIVLGFVGLKSCDNEQHYYIIKTYLLGLTIFALFINLSIVGRIVELFLVMIFVILAYRLNFKKRKLTYGLVVISYLLYFVTSNLRVIA
ncbi:EpsG family protein [Pseudoclostridium thermosuccinogenes]|uniref:EpsG family protein n=1 Tax=Clostridium thermosuccinogenes TaxID=84032 RepID=UPI002FD96232